MTKKDYIAFARIIRDRLPEHPHDVYDTHRADELATVAEAMAGVFILENARFDRQRFLIACGLVRA